MTRNSHGPRRPVGFVLAVLCLITGLTFCACSPEQHEKEATVAPGVTAGISIETENAVVVSADSIASQVGIDVLKQGGNAVDAAVAVAFALAVTYPRAGNIGGGGFMLIRLADGETHFIDYRETAPVAATRDMYLDPLGDVVEGKSTRGALAAGVPGTVAGLGLAHERFGLLTWEDVVSHAWRLAKDGFVVDDSFVRSISDAQELLEMQPETRRIFVDPKLTPGDRFKQPEVAATLRRIMTDGAGEFYRGETADMIAAEMARDGGLITTADLAAYKAVFREPTRVTYRGFEIVSAPLPSSGGIILSELFQILERYSVGDFGYHSRDHVHLFSEAEKIVYRIRSLYMGDSDFYPAPAHGLVAPTYVERLTGLINMSHVLPVRDLDHVDFSPPAAPAEREETTHFSIVDRWGNAVSNTYTLNGSFGSGIAVAGGGFLLNNEMDDFSIKPGYANMYGLVGSEANSIAPGKRMLSSMSPTFVLEDDSLFMVLGTPGGATIPTSVLQVISNVIDFHMSLDQAVAAGRFHEQYLPDEIFIESGALAEPVIAALTGMGHKVSVRSDIGDVQAIMIRSGRHRWDSRIPGGGRLIGVSDPRRNGRAIGY